MSYLNEAAVETETPETSDPEAAVEDTETLETSEPDDEEEFDDNDGEEFDDNDEEEMAEDVEEEAEEETTLPDGKKKQDHAFAEISKENRELRKKVREMERRKSLFDETFGADADVLAIAEEAGITEKEVEEILQEQAETEDLKSENEELKTEITLHRLEVQMEKDLKAIQKLNPEVKGFNDFGGEEAFIELMASQETMTPERAYLIMLNEKDLAARKLRKAPSPIGKVNTSQLPEGQYFTEDEIDALTDEQLEDERILEKVKRSLGRL